MLAECEKVARQAGVKYLRITALARNGRARATYRSFGFSEQFVDFEKVLG
jgi:ribosomal protein S18 acetylase RimI-like enzyme